jgi:ABC-2 type transport system permease protein
MTDAQIHDVGYRGYDGPRTGLGHIIVALGVHTVQRTLGLKRPFKHKILPAAALTIAFLPAVIFVGMAALLPIDLVAENILPTSYAEYLGVIATGVVVFVALVGPEALCPDRRTGMLSLYLASPLDRDTYLVGKAGGIGLVLSLMTTAPLLFLLLAYTIEGSGPDGIVDFVDLLWRILLAGTIVTAYFTALTTAVSSFTTRRAVASAVIVISLIVSGVATSAIVEADAAPDELGLLNLLNVPVEAAARILGDAPDNRERALEDVSGALVIAATLAITLIAAIVARVRYQRLSVSR